ncbi:hypothetical protein A9Q99_15615 [Gammaproteobacteria bacterium 45_16_T64]|nr:hypothetical protein A9Q99_15615 [Gammaproteobacteria bacterium 45_16_T64]
MSQTKSVLAEGKRLLMGAALNLTANTRSLSAFSLRELARSAGLNPNTFYRHFKDFDDLGLTIIEEMMNQIRQPLRDLRREAAESVVPPGSPAISWQENPRLNFVRSIQVSNVTVKLFFEFVESNPKAFILGVRELHGSSPVLRKALRQLMKGFAQDMAEDIEVLGLLPTLSQESLLSVAEVISREMFQLSMDYIEEPERRDEICQQAGTSIVNLTMGSAVMAGHVGLIADALR